MQVADKRQTGGRRRLAGGRHAAGRRQAGGGQVAGRRQAGGRPALVGGGVC